MTLEEFQALRVLEGHRVRMDFSDGQAVIATLLSIESDFDASCHVIYDKVEWSALPHPHDERVAYHAAGEELASCVPYGSEAEP